MAHRCTPPSPSQRTDHLEPDNDSDRDSGVGEEDADSCHGDAGTEEEEVNKRTSCTEEKSSGGEGQASAVFIAFRGNMEDEDFSLKLDSILSGIPNMLDMG